MPTYSGNIRKMCGQAEIGSTVEYSLPIGDSHISMNPLIGTALKVSYQGVINCVHCNTKTKKSFNQGYCYRCLMKLAQCDTCIIKPETCHYEQGTCREPQWGEDNCMNDHFVYLANTGTLKVGITRHVSDGVSSRWIDQGATQAIPILRVKNRLLSGLVETVIKQHIADKTNWRAMLKEHPKEADLIAMREHLFGLVEMELDDIGSQYGLQAISLIDMPAIDIQYPVSEYPSKIKSINLDKEFEFEGVLNGIKGQYWMLDNDRVINMRKYSGYHLDITTN
ncbi:DUF2797 domain-containing protein [Aliiglaciecola sp. 2_MG-2023]|uniref:DUF2797 domain-containing protein n=1 Tax=unclassified Aliiglaciecola TaxID=2593648 RepID=UPI0026E2AD97|nr:MULTISPECIES: DUF2797 domain-containing protein [unclassified Aliiglaciecola]MDO6709805.1 DUF2797 domain-containing protein [Aliiglaciecola sp. 2_MG-2023]MDO6750653.1 DUF2797 domain-containing protein [Aliiglaciecola sp. 1_MG-2023]